MITIAVITSPCWLLLSTGWYVADLARSSPRGHLFYLNSVSSLYDVNEDDMWCDRRDNNLLRGNIIHHMARRVSWVNQLKISTLTSMRMRKRSTYLHNRQTVRWLRRDIYALQRIDEGNHIGSGKRRHNRPSFIISRWKILDHYLKKKRVVDATTNAVKNKMTRRYICLDW
jgi:hypothetical protein